MIVLLSVRQPFVTLLYSLYDVAVASARATAVIAAELRNSVCADKHRAEPLLLCCRAAESCAAGVLQTLCRKYERLLCERKEIVATSGMVPIAAGMMGWIRRRTAPWTRF